MDLLEKIKVGEKFDELDVILYCQDGQKSGSLRGYLDHALLHLSDPTYGGQGCNHFADMRSGKSCYADWILEAVKEEEAEIIIETEETTK
jgi:hypothetical protein